MKLLILNGPNLNLLGTREPDVYGQTSLADVERLLLDSFPDVVFDFVQTNHEGDLIDALQAAATDGTDGVVFNPGGYSHTSVAIRDALASIDVPVIEVHVSNIHAREHYRSRLITAGASTGEISGLGAKGYELAVRYFVGSVDTKAPDE